MTTEPVTVGDLDPERELFYYSNSSRAHFPEADCSCAKRVAAKRARRTTARALFDDTPICKNCLGEDYRGGHSTEVATTEGSA